MYINTHDSIFGAGNHKTFTFLYIISLHSSYKLFHFLKMQQNTNVVFKLEVDERKKKKAMKIVCGFSGTNTSQCYTKPKETNYFGYT